jgi:hypothetical protein
MTARPPLRGVAFGHEELAVAAGHGGLSLMARHCEARSAVAIQVVVRGAMDCFVPRNDSSGGAMTARPPLRGVAFSHEELAVAAGRGDPLAESMAQR